MTKIANVTETTFSSDEPETRHSYKRMYRGFPVLNSDITNSYPSFRMITYRGSRGVFSNF